MSIYHIPLRDSALLCSTRLNLALASFLGCVIIYALRSNLSFAIVCMVEPAKPENASALGGGVSAAVAAEKCPKETSFFSTQEEESTTDTVMGEFDWPKSMQGNLLSAFFWGE